MAEIGNTNGPSGATALNQEKVRPAFEMPNVGDTLKLRYNPYDRMRGILPTDAICDGEEVIEVTVTAIKKAIVNFQ